MPSTHTHKHRLGRGTAEVIFRNSERVLYHAKDEKGAITQRNGCRAPADFDRDWEKA